MESEHLSSWSFASRSVADGRPRCRIVDRLRDAKEEELNDRTKIGQEKRAAVSISTPARSTVKGSQLWFLEG